MDTFSFVLQLLNNPSSAFLVGIAAAFTPCTLAIFPIFLYRFGLWGKDTKVSKNYLGLTIAIISFILSFAFTGLILQQIIVSDFANILRITLGTILIFVGIMQLTGKLNLQMVSNFSHPVAFGATLPWILSFSPCVLAFTANLLVSSTNVGAAAAASTAWQFTLFGMGMLVPVVLLVILGNAAIGVMRKSQQLMYWVELLSPYLIIGSGIYLSSQLVQISSNEVIATAILILILATSFIIYLLRRSSEHRQASKVLIVLNAITWIIVTGIAWSITMPYDAEILAGKELLYACIPGSHQSSPVSVPLALLFGLLAVTMSTWYQYYDRKWRIRINLGIVDQP